METNFVRLHKFNLALIVSLLTLISCKENPATSHHQNEYLVINNLDVNPVRIDFNPAMGIVDTTINIAVTGSYFIDTNTTIIENRPAPNFIYQLIRKSDDELIAEGVFTQTDTNISAQFNVELKTIDFNDFRLFIFALSDDVLVSNTVQSTILVRGFAVAPPIIESASNPDTVKIPASGEQPFLLRARVYHPFEQSLIDRVLVNIRDRNNNLLAGSPFELYDDGGASGNNSGDLVANDSTFSRAFRINSSNNPDVYQLFYFAIDNLGLSSDTIQTQMVIER
jgi:hypothetical protein